MTNKYFTDPWHSKFVTEKVFLQFMEDYNHGKPNKEHLKAAHLDVYMKIIELFETRLSRLRQFKLAKINYNALPNIDINNKILGRETLRSPSTIYRIITRLVKAKAIEKIYHGVQSDYELILKPHLVAIYDRENANFSTNLYRTEIVQVESYLRSNCNLHYVSFLETIKERNMHDEATNCLIVNMEVPIGTIVKDTLQDTVTGNTSKHTKIPVVSTQDQKEKSKKYSVELQKDQERTTELKRKWAVHLVDLYISLMLATEKVFMGARLNAIAYMIDNYFPSNVDNTINTQGREYKARIELAHGFSQTKGSEYFAHFPSDYFSNKYPDNCFANTKKWYNKNHGWTKNKKDNKYLKIALGEYRMSPTKKNFEIQRQYLELHAPDTAAKFFQSQDQVDGNMYYFKALELYKKDPCTENYQIQVAYLQQNAPNKVKYFTKEVNKIAKSNPTAKAKPKSDKELLQQLLGSLNQDPTPDNYDKHMKHIINNVPHLEEQFMMSASIKH